MKRQQGGFTLIELIMVIVILGILAAFALPKFVNLSADARASTLQGAFGSVKSASALIHSSWLAKNDPTTTSIDFEGGSAAIVNGYPAAADIAEVAGVDADNFDITGTGPVIISPKGVADATKCSISYTEATVASAGPPVVTAGPPAITIVATLDCN